MHLSIHHSGPRRGVRQPRRRVAFRRFKGATGHLNRLNRIQAPIHIRFSLNGSLHIRTSFLTVGRHRLPTGSTLLFRPLGPPPAQQLQGPSLLNGLHTKGQDILLRRHRSLTIMTVRLNVREGALE